MSFKEWKPWAHFRPDHSGFYWVRWSIGAPPNLFYLHLSEWGWMVGDHEFDDPEPMDLDTDPEDIHWRHFFGKDDRGCF